MRFDVHLKHFEEEIAWDNGMPISVNDETLWSKLRDHFGVGLWRMNISYKMTYSSINLMKQFSSLNSSLNQWGQLVISPEVEHIFILLLCCSSKGIPLEDGFGDRYGFDLQHPCVQIHCISSKNSPFISFVMLTILTLGHLIPLALNLEALFLNNYDKQNVILRGDGCLELNEVSLRLVILVDFLLLLRLLQLAWTARTQDGNGNHLRAAEKKIVFVCLLLYAPGGLITFLVELDKNVNVNGLPAVSAYNSTISKQSSDMSQQSYTMRYLESYAGLVLDEFLFPHIIFNIFQNLRENSVMFVLYWNDINPCL
ncbi:hypothetical protein ACH5RR_015215 [Cinchona calisaya]|uniref:RING-type E3 ubiquitin transferase n=1 Tax=Cinchona calisaya TaxID=153742 RepID=A0ABD2ZSI3_9GENT